MLYRVLTGANPQEAIARTGGSMLEPMMINRNVPSNISKVIMSGMRLSTDSRIRSITEFVDKLFAQPKYTGEGKSAQERPLTRQQQKKLAKQRKERVKTLVVLGIAGAVLIAFAIVFAMTLSGAFAPQPDETSSVSENISDVSSEIPDPTDDNETSGGTSGESGEATSAPEAPDNSSIPDTSSSVAGANISLPNFTNRSYENTVSRYEGIFTFIPTYEYSEEYSAGMMYDQSIAEGTMVSEGTQIEVKVSKGRSLVPLPDYADTNLPDYINKLSSMNIKYSVKSKRTNDVADGYVAECSKEVGDLVNVEEGETIIVYAARNFEESKPETEEHGEPVTGEESPLPGGRIPVD